MGENQQRRTQEKQHKHPGPTHSQIMRALQADSAQCQVEHDARHAAFLARLNKQPKILESVGHVRIHPQLAQRAEQGGHFSPYRLYTVLRGHDARGRGLFKLRDVIATFSDDKARPGSYLCGKRQLQKLRAAGEGRFWTTYKDRKTGHVWIRLISRARVVASYGELLQGHEVTVSVASLIAARAWTADGVLSPHGQTRKAQAQAAIYDARHTGRKQQEAMSRRAVERMTGLRPQRQRAYEKRARVKAQPAYVLIPDYSEHKEAWAKSLIHPAFFKYRDWQGRAGRKGQTYLARVIGSTYETTGTAVQVQSTRNRRRLNSVLWDSLQKRTAAGNKVERVFWVNRDKALRVAGRECGRADARPVFVACHEKARGLYQDLSDTFHSQYRQSPWGANVTA